MTFKGTRKNLITHRFKPRGNTSNKAHERASTKNGGKDDAPSIGREVARESFERAVKALDMSK